MTRGNRALRFFALTLAGILLTLLLWGLSPGPEWLACSTAERYAERYAADYRYHALVMEGEVSRRVVGSLRMEYPSWTVILSQENDPDFQGPALRLELSDGIFPAAVTTASWWAPEPMELPAIPLPVP